jgi:hypothetical protein
MFYGQCWKCGERWELGTASSCKCPEESEPYKFTDTNTEVLRLSKDGIWANPEIPADEAAKLVLAAIDHNIKVLVDKAVLAEREACAKVCDEAHELMNCSFQGAAAAIRARGNT